MNKMIERMNQLIEVNKEELANKLKCEIRLSGNFEYLVFDLVHPLNGRKVSADWGTLVHSSSCFLRAVDWIRKKRKGYNARSKTYHYPEFNIVFKQEDVV